MADPTITLHTSGTETESGEGTAMSAGSTTIIGMFINISAVSGVLPTLDVQLQHSPNGTDWYDYKTTGVTMKASTLSQTGTTAVYPAANPSFIAEAVRCVWTIGGQNPSFTFSVELTTA